MKQTILLDIENLHNQPQPEVMLTIEDSERLEVVIIIIIKTKVTLIITIL